MAAQTHGYPMDQETIFNDFGVPPSLNLHLEVSEPSEGRPI